MNIEESKSDKEKIVQFAIDAMRKEMPENVFRHKIKQFPSFPFSKGYLQNEDSTGAGPEGSFYCGRYRCYQREKLFRLHKL